MDSDNGNVYDKKLKQKNISFYRDYGYLIVSGLIPWRYCRIEKKLLKFFVEAGEI